MLSIGNSCRNGGGFHVTPQALLDDGLLDVAIGDAMPWHQILTLLPNVLRGTHTNHPKVMIRQCSKIGIACTAPLPVHADGELLTANADALDIEVQPGRLEVIV
jgi:diacylglycerol kinase (ATP)